MWYILGICIYLIGCYIALSEKTIESSKYYEGGFLGMGYIVDSHREANIKEAREVLFWPFSLVLFCAKVIIQIINDALKFPMLLCGIDYSKTKIYNLIDNWNY